MDPFEGTSNFVNVGLELETYGMGTPLGLLGIPKEYQVEGGLAKTPTLEKLMDNHGGAKILEVMASTDKSTDSLLKEP
jgi:hypothetical protein